VRAHASWRGAHMLEEGRILGGKAHQAKGERFLWWVHSC
jgi:hypothetical protein